MSKTVELRFSEQALGELLRFIRYYEEAFFELYRDSGIWSEDSIIQTYRESAQKLYLTILQEIEQRLRLVMVLGRKVSREQWCELSFYVGTRLVIVHYLDDAKRNVRFVQSISIDRKPIIF